MITGYGEIGQRIYNDPLYQKFSKGNTQFIQQLCDDIGLNIKTGYNCIRFYEKFIHGKYTDVSNALESLPEGKNISWHKLVNVYIPQPTEEELNEVESIGLPSGIDLINGDFRHAQIEPESIDLILTDPPYPGEFLPLWDDLGSFGHEVLKPSGYLVAYSGHLYLKEVLISLSKYLKYFWTFCLTLHGSTRHLPQFRIMTGWKPVLIFCKPPFKKPAHSLYDVIDSTTRDKTLHQWQQSEGGVDKLVDYFSKPGETVLDPFSGTGTFAKVASEMGRKAIGIEIDKTTHLKAKKRILSSPKKDQKESYSKDVKSTEKATNKNSATEILNIDSGQKG